MIVNLDDELIAALAHFQAKEPDKVGTLEVARIFQLAVDYRHEAIEGRGAHPAGDVLQGYACTTFPVIARILREGIAARRAQQPGV